MSKPKRKTLKDIKNIPNGTIIHHPDYDENLIIYKEDFDTFSGYEGRWVSGVNNTAESSIAFIMSFVELEKCTVLN